MHWLRAVHVLVACYKLKKKKSHFQIMLTVKVLNTSYFGITFTFPSTYLLTVNALLKRLGFIVISEHYIAQNNFLNKARARCISILQKIPCPLAFTTITKKGFFFLAPPFIFIYLFYSINSHAAIVPTKKINKLHFYKTSPLYVLWANPLVIVFGFSNSVSREKFILKFFFFLNGFVFKIFANADVYTLNSITNPMRN